MVYINGNGVREIYHRVVQDKIELWGQGLGSVVTSKTFRINTGHVAENTFLFKAIFEMLMLDESERPLFVLV